MGGEGTQFSSPSPILGGAKRRGIRGAGRVLGARRPTLHQEVPCVHGLGDRQESQRRPRLGRRREPGPGPLLPQDGGQSFASHLLLSEGKIRPEPRSSQDRSAPAPAPCAKGAWCCRVRTPPPAVPLPTPDQHTRPVRPGPGTSVSARWPRLHLSWQARGGLGVRCFLLHRPAPALPCFLFNNIVREAPAESTRQNFLPGLGLRLRETIPGVLASCPLWDGPAPEERRRHPLPLHLPGILGHTWLSPGGRQQSQDGGMSGEEGGPDFPPPLLYSIPFPLPPGLDPCGGGAPPPRPPANPSKLRATSWG